jgi:hypothetical protein
MKVTLEKTTISNNKTQKIIIILTAVIVRIDLCVDIANYMQNYTSLERAELNEKSLI